MRRPADRLIVTDRTATTTANTTETVATDLVSAAASQTQRTHAGAERCARGFSHIAERIPLGTPFFTTATLL